MSTTAITPPTTPTKFQLNWGERYSTPIVAFKGQFDLFPTNERVFTEFFGTKSQLLPVLLYRLLKAPVLLLVSMPCGTSWNLNTNFGRSIYHTAYIDSVSYRTKDCDEYNKQ